MEKLIIGLCGLAGSGKDTAADMMANFSRSELGMRAARVAFADPMRAMLLALGVPRKYMEERDLKEAVVPGFGASYRRMAQTLGTEWGRHCLGEDFWVRATAAAVDKAEASIVILSDVRFENEADWIYERGGALIRVERPGAAPVLRHASEAAAASLPAGFVLVNDKGLPELESAAGALLSRIYRGRRVV